MSTDGFNGIRMFYKYESSYERIEKIGKDCELKSLIKKYTIESVSLFEMWYGFQAVGTYYIYVPKN